MLALADSLLRSLLDDDVPYGDLTTEHLGIGRERAAIRFQARTPLVACCVPEAARLFALAGGTARALCEDGQRLEPGAAILDGTGSAEAVLAAWKVAQTLIEATAGIATSVRAIADAASLAGGAVVACTRKNFPGTKAAALKAVYAGGGTPHRLGLSDSILIFPEHRVFMTGDPAAHIRRVKASSPERKVAAEVKDVTQALALAEAGVDVLQLEKFPPEQVAEVVRAIASMTERPVVAAAGGVNAGNAEAYVRAGAQVLVTSAPYWARPAEVQVTVARG